MEFSQKNYLATERMISSAILASPHPDPSSVLHGSLGSSPDEPGAVVHVGQHAAFLHPKGIIPSPISPSMRNDPCTPTTMGFRPTGTFPYGISGVAMPSYGYQSELFKYVSNGTPRKSRMCCYCGKIFTRSTTRRYHEKRCPLLRAAGSLVKDDGKGMESANEMEHSPKSQKSDSFSPVSQALPSRPPDEAMEMARENSLYKYTNAMLKENHELPHTSSHDVKPQEESYALQASVNHTTQSHTSFSDATPVDVLNHDNRDSDKKSNVNDNQSTSNLNLFDVSFNAEQFASQEIDRLFGPACVENMTAVKEEIYEDEADDAYKDNSDDNEDDGPAVDDNPGSANSGTNFTSIDNQKACDNDDDLNDEKDEKPNLKNIAPYRCTICQNTFDSPRTLELHEQLHTKFKPYPCRFCGKRFTKLAVRIKHECSHSNNNNKLYSCPVCCMEFTQRFNLRLHLRRYHYTPPHQCRYCHESFAQLIDLGEHLLSHDLSDSHKECLNMLSESLEEVPLIEGEENTLNGTNGDLDDSKNESSSEPDDDIDEPEPELEPEAAPGAEPQPPVLIPENTELCKHCGKSFHKSQMRFHEKEHAAEKPYECPICQKRFGYRNNLKSHLKLHEGIKPYHCQVCNARFTRGSTLRRHARKHGIYPESLWDMFLKSDEKKAAIHNQGAQNVPQSLAATANTYLSSLKSSAFSNGQTHHPIPTSVYTSYNSGMSNATSMLLAATPFTQNYYASQAAQALQHSALNLSLHDHMTKQPHLPPSTDISVNQHHHVPRTLPSPAQAMEYNDSEQGTEIGHVGIQVKPKMFSASCQANLCCKNSDPPNANLRPSSTESSHLSSPSSFSGSEVPCGSSKEMKGDVNEMLAGLVSAGKLYKCELCECFYTEYAMYRIHKRLHLRNQNDPYTCPVCEEDCHDKVYFSLHIYEHLH